MFNKPVACGPHDPAGWHSYCKGDKRTVLRPRWVVRNRGAARASGRTPAAARAAGRAAPGGVTPRSREPARRVLRRRERVRHGAAVRRRDLPRRPGAELGELRVPGLLRDPSELAGRRPIGCPPCACSIPEPRETSPDGWPRPAALRTRRRRTRARTWRSTWCPRSTARRRSTGAPGALRRRLDRELFHHLRTQADAVMVGAGRSAPSATARSSRRTSCATSARPRGCEPEALAVVVSGRLDLPATCRCSSEAEQRVVMATGSDGEVPGTRGAGGVRAGGGRSAAAVARLRSEHGDRARSCARAAPRWTRSCSQPAWWTSSSSPSTRRCWAGRAALTIVAGRGARRARRAGADVARRGRRRACFTRWR